MSDKSADYSSHTPHTIGDDRRTTGITEIPFEDLLTELRNYREEVRQSFCASPPVADEDLPPYLRGRVAGLTNAIDLVWVCVRENGGA